jgi:hypothetical protein
MQLTSSAINILFSLKRPAAPEKVNAISKPNKAKTAALDRTQAAARSLRFLRAAPDGKTTASLDQDQHAEEK